MKHKIEYDGCGLVGDLPDDGDWVYFKDSLGTIEKCRFKLDAYSHLFPNPEKLIEEKVIAWSYILEDLIEDDEALSKNIAERITMPYKHPKAELLDNGNYIFKIVDTVATARARQINKIYLEALYAAYKDTDVSEVLVIDMTNFEEFIRRYLPIYLEEKEQQK